MRFYFFLIALLSGSLGKINPTFAHFGLGGDEDVGHALFWFYGILLVGIIGSVIYRKLLTRHETPKRQELKQHLREFERSLSSCVAQLQNADDYPNECGLSDQQRTEKNESVALIQNKIDEIKMELATT